MFKHLFLVFLLASSLVYSTPKKIVAAAYKNNSIKAPVIVLDAGHGGLDRGAKIKYPYCEEKRLTLTTTLLTKKYLEQMGYKVVLTRATDLFVPLKKRVDIANGNNCDLFVSIHFNSCPNQSAHGIEIYYFDSKENKKRAKTSQSLASIILNTLTKKVKAHPRGVKRGSFCVVRDTKMPSVLIEGGFMTNPKERDNLRKKVYLDRLSTGIAQGIDNYIKTL